MGKSQGIYKKETDLRQMEHVLLEMSLGSQENNHTIQIISAKAKTFTSANGCITDPIQASKHTQLVFHSWGKGVGPMPKSEWSALSLTLLRDWPI